MKELFDQLSEECSKITTSKYSTSFSTAVGMLSKSIRKDIYNIYGFVRVADEIVDSFHDSDKEYLLNKFEKDFYEALENGISTNPILHSFQQTVSKYDIDLALIDAFLKSMKMDLQKKEYKTQEEYENYIYGSADVVGLMCLKVFVNGDEKTYQKLKPSAMKLGSAFQKVNFLRDLKSDVEILERSYFPGIDLKDLNLKTKEKIINEIENDFSEAFTGISQLPSSAKFGVYTAVIYYRQLLKKLKRTPHNKITETRIRVNDFTKFGLLVRCYFIIKLKLI